VANEQAKLRGYKYFGRTAVSFSLLLGGSLDAFISAFVNPDTRSLGCCDPALDQDRLGQMVFTPARSRRMLFLYLYFG
jgi:hypothetical protein